ncbi:MAG: hypothetical protein IKS10_06180 [Lachnospiraceae bacterium]|nr:hypothetical protein [Lachnospiraceae bacterium]
MKIIDIRFSASDMAEIQSMVGKKLLKYICDPFLFSPSVYGIVGIVLEDESYAFTNLVSVMDYFGVPEDVAVFKICAQSFSDIHSLVQNQQMIETSVHAVISEICVVNERQKLFVNGAQTYEVLLTRGIIFKFEDGHELSFEKNIWFSEDIYVRKGYNLIDQFTPTGEFEESWYDDHRGECTREIITLK